MANNDFQDEEADEAAGDPQIRGKVEKGANFKPLSHPNIGKADDQEFGGFGKVKVDAELPKDPAKLPQVSGKE